MRNNFFPTAFSLFAEILSDLFPRGAAIYQMWQPRCLIHLVYPSIKLYASALFKRFWKLTIRIENG